jgi:hypothetical protein
MLFKPLLDRDNGTLIRLWRRVGPVKYADLMEKVDRDAASFSLGDLGPEPYEECFDVLPGDVRAGRMGKDGFEGLTMAAFHGAMVPRTGTAARLLRPNVRAKLPAEAGTVSSD